MNVLLTTHRLPPDGVAGVERITEDLANGLALRGETVTVATRQWSRRARIVRRWKREVTSTGVRVERLPGVPAPLERAFAEDERVSRDFLQIFGAARPDVVHVMHAYGFSPGCIDAALERRVPLVVSLQDFFFACPLAHLEKKDGRLCPGPYGGKECAATCFRDDPRADARWSLRAAYFRAVLAAATDVIAPSQHVASYFTAEGIAARPIRVIANGLALGERPARPCARPQRGRLRLGYVGAVASTKGVDLIFDALALTDRESRPESLLVAGAEPNRPYAKRLRATAGRLEGVDVSFAGEYERPALERLLADVDIVVVPSRVPETFSLTVREAQALGIPTIVARVGALPDAIEEGVTGWSFTVNSPGSLAQVFDRLAADPASVKRARTAVSRLHFTTVDDHVEQVLDVYRSAVTASSVPDELQAEVASLRQALARLA
jgi:glycosyltransferase involved in cell wall biosynthesis